MGDNMYYIGIQIYTGEWQIVKSVRTKEAAVETLRKIRGHKIKAAAFVLREGKYRKLVNL